MIENLQSARNIHQILIVACAAIWIFSLSMPDEQNKYQQALDELVSLEELFMDTEANLRKEPTSYDSLNLLYRQDLYKADTLLQKLKRSNMSEIKQFFNSTWNDAHGRVIDRKILSLFIIEHFRYNGLINGQKYANQSLPLLLNVWDLVRYETIEDSKRQLKSEAIEFAKKPESNLDIAGLHVNGSDIYIIAPFVSIALLVYLLVLVNHIIYNLVKENEPLVKSFPWMALFPTLLSQSLTICTLLVFPAVVSYTIIFRSPLSDTQSNYLMITYTILYSITGASLFIKILNIQNRVHYNNDLWGKKKNPIDKSSPEQVAKRK